MSVVLDLPGEPRVELPPGVHAMVVPRPIAADAVRAAQGDPSALSGWWVDGRVPSRSAGARARIRVASEDWLVVEDAPTMLEALRLAGTPEAVARASLARVGIGERASPASLPMTRRARLSLELALAEASAVTIVDDPLSWSSDDGELRLRLAESASRGSIVLAFVRAAADAVVLGARLLGAPRALPPRPSGAIRVVLDEPRALAAQVLNAEEITALSLSERTLVASGPDADAVARVLLSALARLGRLPDTLTREESGS